MRVEPDVAEVHHRHGILADHEQALADAAHRAALGLAPVGLAAETQRIGHWLVGGVDCAGR